MGCKASSLFFLTYVIPMALVATYPTMTVVDDIEMSQTLQIALVELALLMLWTAIFSRVWNAEIEMASTYGLFGLHSIAVRVSNPLKVQGT